IGQDLAVEADAGELECVDELAVGHAFGADCGVDALDPQSAEAALLRLAVAVGILPGLLDRLAGDADGVLAAAVIALRLLEQPFVLGASGYAAFDACHGPASLPQAVRGPGLDARRIGVGKDLGPTVLANIFGVVADQAVALARDTHLDLAGRRELEALFDAALGLQLGHFLSFARPASEFLNRHGSPFGRAVLVVSNDLEARAYRGGSLVAQPTTAARSHR